MKKIISFILASIVALGFSITVANSAAKEVRVAFFLEWPTPNQEDKVKGLYEKALKTFLEPEFIDIFEKEIASYNDYPN